MAETLKFVYVLILFISTFLVIIVYDSKTFYFSLPCKIDKDCPRNPPLNIRCRKSFCVQI
ncbi:Nodule Cysteine-Rich (NCR) secreted peptide [Medicago truncatula]|uniref:Nodule Cysteine-Rich (NCR) secreted peptide n=1 Tax=Medicago truncatula TaxID=3880 RepID=A0A072VEW9_MEDTR|nr:Nodule Cysteine-Rich (NCR) secreted peptide [Medicago truncatula]